MKGWFNDKKNYNYSAMYLLSLDVNKIMGSAKDGKLLKYGRKMPEIFFKIKGEDKL